MTRLVVISAGWSSTIQDAGRPGLGAYGVTGAGPVDPRRAAVVNRLVGNPAEAAIIETAGGLVITATGPALIASTAGATVVALGAGERHALPPDPRCNYGYLAVRGGLDIAPVLGSRSTDTLTGIGPPALTDGVEIDIGADPGTSIHVDSAPLSMHRRLIDLWPGPHQDEVLDVGEMSTAEWTPSIERNRTGIRLDGHRLRRRSSAEIAPIGLVPGAIQIPPDGRPIVVGRDHPVTGGYPVIAVVDGDHLADLAQCPPGERLHFRWAT